MDLTKSTRVCAHIHTHVHTRTRARTKPDENPPREGPIVMLPPTVGDGGGPLPSAAAGIGRIHTGPWEKGRDSSRGEFYAHVLAKWDSWVKGGGRGPGMSCRFLLPGF